MRRYSAYATQQGASPDGRWSGGVGADDDDEGSYYGGGGGNATTFGGGVGTSSAYGGSSPQPHFSKVYGRPTAGTYSSGRGGSQDPSSTLGPAAVDLSYYQRYKSLGTQEYQTAFGITALAEVVLDRVLTDLPENPWVLMATVCREWSDKANEEARRLYGEDANANTSSGRSPSPAAGGGVGASRRPTLAGGMLGNTNNGLSPSRGGTANTTNNSHITHPPVLPWRHARPVIPSGQQQQGGGAGTSTSSYSASAYNTSGGGNSTGGMYKVGGYGGGSSSNNGYGDAASQHQQQGPTYRAALGPYWAKTNTSSNSATSAFTYACKDYVQRQRIACVIDEWFFAITSEKPFSPALFSYNFFRQRAFMRNVVREEDELGTTLLTEEERSRARSMRNMSVGGGSVGEGDGATNGGPSAAVAGLLSTAGAPLGNTSTTSLPTPTKAGSSNDLLQQRRASNLSGGGGGSTFPMMAGGAKASNGTGNTTLSRPGSGSGGAAANAAMFGGRNNGSASIAANNGGGGKPFVPPAASAGGVGNAISRFNQQSNTAGGGLAIPPPNAGGNAAGRGRQLGAATTNATANGQQSPLLSQPSPTPTPNALSSSNYNTTTPSLNDYPSISPFVEVSARTTPGLGGEWGQ